MHPNWKEVQQNIYCPFVQVGKVITVLCEGYDPVSEAYFGRSEADAPEIDGKVYFTSVTKHPEGEFVKVEITEILDYDLIGEALV